MAGLSKVQGKGVQGSGDPVTLTFDSTPTANNLIIVSIATIYDLPSLAVTDNKGNTYTKQATSATTGGNRNGATVWYAYAVTATATFTVSADPGAGAADISMHILEAATPLAAAPGDGAVGQDYVASSTTPSSGNLAATAVADELLVGVLAFFGARVTTADAAWTLEYEDETEDLTPFSVITRGLTGGLAASTVDDASWTFGSATGYVAAAASFKPLAAAAARVPTRRDPQLAAWRGY